jgi:hypothetical protein
MVYEADRSEKDENRHTTSFRGPKTVCFGWSINSGSAPTGAQVRNEEISVTSQIPQMLKQPRPRPVGVYRDRGTVWAIYAVSP